MKGKILGLLAVALLAGSSVANASLVYTFANAQESPTFSFSFTVDDFITTAGLLPVTPLEIGGFTFNIAWTSLYGTGICFEFATYEVTLLTQTDICGYRNVDLGEAAMFMVYQPMPAGLGSFTSEASAAAFVSVAPYLTITESTAVPEPGTLALLASASPVSA